MIITLITIITILTIMIPNDQHIHFPWTSITITTVIIIIITIITTSITITIQDQHIHFPSSYISIVGRLGRLVGHAHGGALPGLLRGLAQLEGP